MRATERMPELHRVTVRVPATTANLGPGFDCLGMALDIWNELTVERGPFSITVEGEGRDAPSLPRGSSNLLVAGVEAAYRAAGRCAPELAFSSVNRIPYARGLGSSSAAIVAGLIAGSALAGTEPDPHMLLDLAADLDGHPDNVAAAIAGGCRIGIHADSRWVSDGVAVPEGIKAVLYIPEAEGPTREARGLLAAEIERADAVYNIGRAALLVNAFTSGRLELLKYATEDRLHQPARSAIYPATKRLISAAITAGAHGAFLSGAGPSVVALTTQHEMTVAYEMAEAARLHNVPGRIIVTEPSARGAYLASAQ